MKVRRASERALRCALALTAVAACWAPGIGAAQESSAADPVAPGQGARAFSLTPSASLRETWTDNYRLTPDAQSDLVSEATLAVRAVANGRRLRGTLDYAATALGYARHSDENDVQHTLYGNGTAELLQDRVFLDARASVAQQQVSAFGTTSTDNALANRNRTEVRTLSLSPYLRGPLGSSAQYELRFNRDTTSNSSFGVGNYTNTGWQLQAQGGESRRTSAWSLTANSQKVDYDQGSTSQTELLRGTLSLPLTSSITATAIAGAERNDLRSSDMETSSLSGAELAWVPSERTSLTARVERRYFGTSHAVSFSFRTPRTVWTFTDSTDASTSSSRSGSGQGTVYDLLYTQFASQFPSPADRDAAVRSFLALYGIDPNSVVIPGFLTASPTLQRVQAVSLALMGIRTTVIFQASQTSTRQLRRATDTGDDLAGNGSVRQRGFTTSVSHRLTPSTSANSSLSWQRTEGDNSRGSSLRSLSAGLSTQLGPRTQAQLSARYTRSNGSFSPYTERAVVATLGYQF